MNLFQAIILGIVQGITEFLPVSSSGHLVIVPHLIGWQFGQQEAFIFDVLVQLGTLLAVIIYFWKDLTGILWAWLQAVIRRPSNDKVKAKLGWFLILATIPAGVAGLALKDQVEAAFSSITATAMAMIFTAIFLVLGEWLGNRNKPLSKLTWLDSLVMGTFQAMAIFPGISRSGATITGGLLRDLDRQGAARFSFLMSVPIMLAAGVIAVIDLLEVPNFVDFLPSLFVGFVVAALVGYLAIAWLLRYLANHSLSNFSIYLVLVAAVLLVT